MEEAEDTLAEVTPRLTTNCSQEIPVTYRGQPYFVDPVSLVLLTHGEAVRCNDVAPPRWFIAGRWYCGFSGAIRECHEPPRIPVSQVEVIEDEKLPWGLGRSLYTPEQLEDFYNFQQAQAVRSAFVADQAEAAFQDRGPSGEWGLGLGQGAKQSLLHLVGSSFIPLYWLVGPVATTVIFVMFFLGMARVIVTILLRTLVIARARGCGLWILSAPFSTLYHLALSPFIWVDNAAKTVADRVQKAMEDAAGQEAEASLIRRSDLYERMRNLGRAVVSPAKPAEDDKNTQNSATGEPSPTV